MLTLLTAPNPILRQRAAALALPPSESIGRLARDMFEAMQAYSGVGLAAPQIGQAVRLFVIGGGRPESQPQAYLNPEIIKKSWKKIKIEEGCLSLPGLFGIVRRPQRVFVRYLDLSGMPHKEWLDGLTARIYQHELDHLDGRLFPDLAQRITQGRELLADYGLA